MWHANIEVTYLSGEKARAFPTRTRFDGTGSFDDIVGFTQAQHVQSVAAHELGHFLVNWKLGAFMRRITVECDPEDPFPVGGVVFAYPDGNPARNTLVGGAAGERAHDRWLREEGLWTPGRAVSGEVQGGDDREAALALDPTLTFDGGPNDYRHLQDEADAILDEEWSRLRLGLAHFPSYARYSGNRMCRLLDIENNPAI